ncbi:MAG TPA: transketolase C-terminal domain-containing protein [Candidatus Methanomethylicus sp.]|nr:transketolase C-terminal domain-containing protein [Candidatus Methanomethylicus sp.]HRR54272.1 transketolase C-terminal domain-containing protein [Candidatus Methanomethylicus sp.]
MKKVGLSGNYAIAYAVKMADVDVIAAYPITPQTTIVEKLSEFVANGELDADYINVESEHSAMSACVGASMTGARVFTATSSQGLAFMHEVLFMAAALRTPMVMANVNRALSAPLNIWNDHADAMAERDAGWIQLWVSSAQEAYDTTLMAFKLSEETRLPVMVNLDGYVLSHTYEPVELIAEEAVRKYIPSRPLVNRLSPKTAFSVGVVGPPEYYFEMKYQAIDAIERSRMPISKITADFNRSFGRSYDDVYAYGMEDAEYALLTMGSMTGSARVVAEELRKEGLKAGVVSIRTFRPFPVERLIEKVDGLMGLGVMDRASTPGGPSNPLFSDIAACLCGLKDRPILQSFVSGLGGRDISPDNFRTMFKATKEAADAKAPKPCMYVGLRE